MKKFYLFAAIAALFAVSCTTDMTKDVECLPIGENQIFVSFEEQGDTRIQLNEECKTVWTKGDLISVFEKNRANACWRYIGATGKRNGAFIPKSSASSTQSLDKVVVVYPYDENYTISADKRIVTTLPAEQLYHTGSYSVGDNLMVSQSDDRNFVLKSVCGWLKFQFVGTGVITKIEFSGNNYEQIAGKVRVDCTDASLDLIEDMLEDPTTDDGEVGGTLIDPEDYVTTVALNCGEEGVALNSDTVTDFYLILPPQTFESGITVKVTCADGTVVEKSTKSPLTISRNAIQPMTALTINGKPATPASNEIWYTATEKVVKDNWTVDTFGANITDHTFDTTTGKGVITFDGEVTEIGYQAFYECRSLTSVTIPDSVTEIGRFAFYDCDGLTSVTIPDSVTKIGDAAFYDCDGLTSITIPDSVTQIDINPFDSCANLAEFKGKFASEDGRCLIVDGILNSFAPAGLTEYAIPDSVTEIGSLAFGDCSGLTSITIPNSVTSIGNHAFHYCDGLTSITIPDSVTEIRDLAFNYCSSLTSVFCERTTPPTAYYESGSWEAFDHNAADRKIYVPAESVDAYKSADGWKEYADAIVADPATLPATNEIWYTATAKVVKDNWTVDTFGANITDHTFDTTTGKGIITFDGEVTKIGDNAFYECQSLTSVTIPDSVTEIETNPFLLCFNLTEFKGKFASKDGKCLIEDQGDGGFVVLRAFAGAGLTEYSIPDGVTALDNCVFKGWGFTSITIPDSVTSMGIEVFYCCNNLRSITIPDSVEGILMNTFWGCSNLRNVTIGNGVTSIGRYAFCRCENLTDISLGSHVETIEQGAFSMCSSLESITIPDSVTEIGSHTFEYCGNLSEFKGKFAADNGRCLIIDGVLNSFAPAGITTYNIPDGVTQIGEGAFECCSGLTSITIPDSVTKIGNSAFRNCSNLTSVFCERTTPPTALIEYSSWNTFDSNAADRKIYVPTDSVDAYKAADGWKDYADAIVGYNF